jgi:cytochrome b561
MLFKNSQDRYGLPAIIFHWLMALIIIGMLCLGLYMTGLPKGLQKLKFYGWHKEFGILILMLVSLRLGWRMSNVSPSMPSHLAVWQRFAAYAAHYALYFFMFTMPLTGWLLSSSAGVSVSFFGLFVMPDLMAPDKAWHEVFEFAHEWLAYGLIATICVHAAAALQHHFYYKDNILRRMFP